MIDALLYRKDVLSFLLIPDAVSLSQDRFFRSPHVQEGAAHSLPTLQNQNTQRKNWERAMVSERSDVWCSTEKSKSAAVVARETDPSLLKEHSSFLEV